MSQPKYPAVIANLSGRDGNAFNLLGIVSRAMRDCQVPDQEIAAFKTEAMSGDYNNLLRTCVAWVDVR